MYCAFLATRADTWCVGPFYTQLLPVLRATHALGQGLWDRLGGQTSRPSRLLLNVSFKHPWTLPWTPGSHHRLNRSTEGSGAHPRPECHREPLCFRWLGSQLDRRCQRRGGGRRASDPSFLSETGEAQTQGTPFFLYEKIRSGNIIGKTFL